MEYSLNQYILIIEPSAALKEGMAAYYTRFAENYEAAAHIRAHANISLVRFQQYEMMEVRIMAPLGRIIQSFNPIIIDIHGFGSFPTHTIFFNIATKNELIVLVKAIASIRGLLTPDKDHKAHFITDPYIVLANKLLPWQFEKGWLEMSHTPFSGRFVATEIKLLRKRASEQQYRVIKKIPLLHQKVMPAIQGHLFL
ncbi:MAG: 2'-5' RNA ligase family protein [Chitinophagaceae bacterium]|nr:2'-5' RNA ligase family protein [Chitinophagaceae bacterium]